MTRKQHHRLTLSLFIALILCLTIINNEVYPQNNASDINIQQENMSIEVIESNNSSENLNLTIKELKKELNALKQAYKSESIDKQTYDKKKKSIHDKLKNLETTSFQKDTELTDDMLFQNANPNSSDDEPITTDEEIERLETE